jgi:hypothetical protein
MNPRTEDGQALHRLPVQNLSQSISCQLRLANRLAHVRPDVTVGLRSTVSGAHHVVAESLAVVTSVSPAIIPEKVTLMVVLGLGLGGWAIVKRRVILGLVLILLALAVAGVAALAQEGQQAVHAGSGQVVTARSIAA